MALGAQLPVRLPPEIEERLENVARKIGTTKSALIRMLAKTFVEQVVDPEGNVNLPPKWHKLLEAADGRSSAFSLNEAAEPYRVSRVVEGKGPSSKGPPGRAAEKARRIVSSKAATIRKP